MEEWLEVPRGVPSLESGGKAEVRLETLDRVGTKVSEGGRPL